MGPLLPISEVLIPLELSGGTQDNHENQKPLILGLLVLYGNLIWEKTAYTILFLTSKHTLWDPNYLLVKSSYLLNYQGALRTIMKIKNRSF